LCRDSLSEEVLRRGKPASLLSRASSSWVSEISWRAQGDCISFRIAFTPPMGELQRAPPGACWRIKGRPFQGGSRGCFNSWCSAYQNIIFWRLCPTNWRYTSNYFEKLSEPNPFNMPCIWLLEEGWEQTWVYVTTYNVHGGGADFAFFADVEEKGSPSSWIKVNPPELCVWVLLIHPHVIRPKRYSK
jgi:hypothetical protein